MLDDREKRRVAECRGGRHVDLSRDMQDRLALGDVVEQFDVQGQLPNSTFSRDPTARERHDPEPTLGGTPDCRNDGSPESLGSVPSLNPWTVAAPGWSDRHVTAG